MLSQPSRRLTLIGLLSGTAATLLSTEPVSPAPTAANDNEPPPSREIICATISAVADKYGIDRNVLIRMAQLESNLNPYAYNRSSGASGLFQSLHAEAKQYNLSHPFCCAANAEAAARLLKDNERTLRNALGRKPSPGELYLAHQQGASGAARLLKNPTKKAIDLVRAGAVLANGGHAEMTAGEFSGYWLEKFAQCDRR